MSDKELREFERGWKGGASAEAEAVYFRKKLRIGMFSNEQLHLLGQLGYKPAIKACTERNIEVGEFSFAHLKDQELVVRCILPVIQFLIQRLPDGVKSHRKSFDSMVLEPKKWLGCLDECIDPSFTDFEQQWGKIYDEEDPTEEEDEGESHSDWCERNLPDDEWGCNLQSTILEENHSSHRLEAEEKESTYEEVIASEILTDYENLHSAIGMSGSADRFLYRITQTLFCFPSWEFPYLAERPFQGLLGEENLVELISAEVTPWLLGHNDPVKARLQGYK